MSEKKQEKKLLEFPGDGRHSPERAKELIRACLKLGVLGYSTPALAEMKDDCLDTVDVVSVLRGGWVEEPELEKGTWRYRVKTNRLCVVVAFRSLTHVVVVTAWRM